MKTSSLFDFEQTLKGKRILVTGHTGFTGSWASLWLSQIGAEVAGYSLAPDQTPALFDEMGIGGAIDSTIADICDYVALKDQFDRFKPDAVLHLAAQPLVRRSYREPVSTFAVNAIGTAHVLEAARLTRSVRAAVCITTDKVYKNNEWAWPYRENDPLGGKDPYSASKAAAEMIIDSYRSSFGKTDGTGVAIATARGGNIIGGGDWSEDRLVPDFVRAVVERKQMTLRYPDATRPWQHVLALVQGYLMLIAGLLNEPAKYARAWNLGPQDPRNVSVREVLDDLSANWQRPDLDYMEAPLPEAGALALDSSLARNHLGWTPPWDTRRVVSETAKWYRDYYADPTGAKNISLKQLQTWRADLAATGN
ncbi:MAG: CDP-glucose 4,6-dehydratase [Pseudomonadota bacterium]|uniref:CDP-glucose 4,6-dehydratase n=1 Tax=Burkholderia sp. PAMC 26561 TaxID=1795043 RepID=UPI00076B7386|nr:CDP-glucose 4,6-dehydratase [Burkholderia sp. PAMC 26561]AME22843.1 CDP-glucose 4,6-dehydratase [Burkholderia sp. PAMC 26561]MDP9154914.1 CDP-glucose 4,6-dehydratase [Pseudomonadota bacterium]